MNRFVVAVAALGAAGVGLAAIAAAQEPGRSASDGVYTTEQADRGEALYADQCAVCHGSVADITPSMAPLLGDYVFRDTWKDRSIGDLFERIRVTMPQSQPGSLSPPDTASIVALILRANQLPAGSVALGDDVEQLRQIRLSW